MKESRLLASRLRMNGLALGDPEHLARDLHGEPGSRCWVPDDQVFMVVYSDMRIAFSGDARLVDIHGSQLTLDGSPVCALGEPDHRLEAVFGKAADRREDRDMVGWRFDLLDAELFVVAVRDEIESLRLRRRTD